jgi:RNA polymerase sigma factor (sigma-70 family)
MAEQSWAQVLEGATRRDEASLLRLTRHVTQLLARYGAYAVRDDWTTLAREIAEEAPRSFSGRSDAGGHIESVAKNRFWGKVLDLMTESDPKASALFFPTVRKLLATWDGSRAQEAVWDDIVSETSIQIWERWRARDVEKPWALLCTIAKRRFLDRVRATRPTDELDQETVEDERDASPGEEIFTQQALGVLDEQEREIVVRMDLEGETRIEIAKSMGVSEGQVLSLRRAGLRKIWRWIGDTLPPGPREIWAEMFKGSKRLSPEQVAQKLGLELGEVYDALSQARALTGLG